MNDSVQEMETVKPFDGGAFTEALDKNNTFISFAPMEQKELVCTSPQNVLSKKFGDEKLMLRLQVIRLNGEACNPPKQWDITNPGLLRQMMVVLSTRAAAWRVVVKRGSGVAKSTTYSMMHLPME